MKASEEERLDALAANRCKELSGYMCVRCGKRSPYAEDLKEGLQWAHVISRSYKTIRWSLKNCLCLCSGCHFWAHKFPVEFGIWLVKCFGEKWYYSLKRTPKKKLFFDEVKKSLEEATIDDCLIPNKYWEEELNIGDC